MSLSLLMEEKPHGAAVTNSAKVALCCLWNVTFCCIRYSLREVCVCVWTTRMAMSGRPVTFLGAFTKKRRTTIRFLTSACLTTWNSAANAQISIKFDI